MTEDEFMAWLIVASIFVGLVLAIALGGIMADGAVHVVKCVAANKCD